MLASILNWNPLLTYAPSGAGVHHRHVRSTRRTCSQCSRRFTGDEQCDLQPLQLARSNTKPGRVPSPHSSPLPPTTPQTRIVCAFVICQQRTGATSQSLPAVSVRSAAASRDWMLPDCDDGSRESMSGPWASGVLVLWPDGVARR